MIFTGGSGLLGSEIRKILPDINYPSSEEFDVTNLEQMDEFLKRGTFELIIHAAAYTSPPHVDENPVNALDVNIIGTSNIVKLCIEHDLKLIYISTDYVFKGDKGNYQEDDPVYPVNKYAWSKLGGECSVRMYDNAVIIRTSFSPNIFPYENAFEDQWTSRESVTDIANKISKVIKSDFIGTVHLGSKRRTVFEYANSLDANKPIGKNSIKDVPFNAPVDTSLNVDKYKRLIED